MKTILSGGAASILLAAPAVAVTYTLDFSGDICITPTGACSNGTVISQSYGDTAIVDVSHGQNLSDPSPPGLVWWDSGYSDLVGVGWGSSTSTAVSAFVRLVPAAGYQVTLLSFQLGAWTTAFTTPVSIILGELETLDLGNVTIPYPASLTIAGPWSDDGSIEIRWGAPWYVAIDNIVFSVAAIDGGGGGGNGPSPIPLPASAALLGLGLAGLGVLRRRRR